MKFLLQGMVNIMVESTSSMVRSWETKIKREKGEIAEIKIDEDLKNLSADIISRACFGSNYSQGEQTFLKLRTLQDIMSKKFNGIPGSRYYFLHFPITYYLAILMNSILLIIFEGLSHTNTHTQRTPLRKQYIICFSILIL